MSRCVVLVMLTCAAAQAATVERLALPELTGRAERIVTGTCLAVEATAVDGQPQTRFRFRIDQTLKGQAGTEAELLLPGGVADGVRLTANRTSRTSTPPTAR